MVICVLLPLLALRAALGDAQNRLQEPVALAPQHDSAQLIGPVSPAAHQLGVRAGMGLGEAVDICPRLTLITPDPTRAESVWEGFLNRIESIGAEVESERDGEAFFHADGIERLHGGLDGVIDLVSKRLGPAVRIGAAPTRLAAFAAAHRSRRQADDKAFIIAPEQLQQSLDSLPVTILNGRLGGPEAACRRMTSSLVRLGIHRLGSLREISRDGIADRFGELGIEALEATLGIEPKLRPRTPREVLKESLELPEAGSGIHLQSALTILCDRVASRLAGAGMSARTVAMEARLSGGGSWSRETAPREPTGRADLLRMILSPGLEQLPRPAEHLGLRVTGMTAAAPKQTELSRRPEETRLLRLNEAALQVRAVVGESGLMRVLDADIDSHLPERRMLLTPYLS
jgi:nucleotidyltransferase/DNA polymerase involved in DNA repair